MIRNGEASLDASAARLRRAIETLEGRLAALREAPPPPPADTGELDALQAELREKRLRERALEAAAAEASTVLGRAAEQIRAALEDEDEPGDESPGIDEPYADLDALSDDQTDLHTTPSREF